MAKSSSEHKRVVKGTNQGRKNVKTSTMNKSMKSSYKRYRGQGH